MSYRGKMSLNKISSTMQGFCHLSPSPPHRTLPPTTHLNSLCFLYVKYNVLRENGKNTYF